MQKRKGKYYLSTKKDYSARFATDAIKEFYDKKVRRSKYGILEYIYLNVKIGFIPMLAKWFLLQSPIMGANRTVWGRTDKFVFFLCD